MKILIDLDDTVWDLLSVWVFYLNKIYNLDVKVSDIKEWDMKKTFTTLSNEQIIEPLTWMSLWDNITPFPGSVECVKELSFDNDVYFVTATDYRNIGFKVDLLRRHFPFISINNLIIAQNKDMILGDILIDDKVDNLKNRNRGILITSTFNKNADISSFPNIIRLDDWLKILYYIKNYINK